MAGKLSSNLAALGKTFAIARVVALAFTPPSPHENWIDHDPCLSHRMSKENLLIVADSERDANMLYAVRMFVPDPFIYFNGGGHPFMIMSDLEIDRARKQAPHCKVLSFAEYQERLKKNGVKKPSL